METRERIIQAALKLFNARGVESVSVRDIAKEAGISHGNLRYHFQKTDDTKGQIVEALFVDCEEKASAAVREVLTPPVTMSKLVKVAKLQAQYFWEFRFLLDHLMAVCTQYPFVQEGMTRMYQSRRQELIVLMQELGKEGLLKTSISTDELDALVRHYLLVVDLGVPYVKLFDADLPATDQFQQYWQMWFFPLKAYLTPSGTQALEQALEQA